MFRLFKENYSDKNRLIELDVIRGICALATLLYHYTDYIYSVNQKKDWVLDVMEFGKYGVHFFFVISGFVIFMTLEKSKHPKDFLVSRFSRLYPAYWTCLIITTLVVIYSPYYAFHPITTTQFIANLSMFQHWMNIEDIDGVYWTMAVELCFYVLIFSVFIFRKQKNIEWIGIGWLLLMITVYLLMKQQVLPTGNYYYYIPLLRNGTLFFGGILFYKLRKEPTQKRIYFLLVLTLGTHFLINSTEETLIVVFIYLIMFLFVNNKFKFTNRNILYFFGVISYPLYLLHQYAGYEVINFLNANAIENTFLKISITSLLVILIATFVTFLVERPAMKFLRRKFLSKTS